MTSFICFSLFLTGGIYYLPTVFRIRDILMRIWILGSEHWITDPDPSVLTVAIKMPTKT